MFFEMLGVGLIYPLVTLLIDVDKSSIYIKEYFFLNYFKDFDSLDFLYFFIFIIALVYFIKTIFFIGFNWYRAKFMRYLISDVSQDLYNKYLNQPYTFNLTRTPSSLMRNAYQTVIVFVSGYVDAILLYITQGLILIGIIFALLFIEPLGIIFMGIFLLMLSYLYIKFSKSFLIKLGTDRIINEGLKLKLIQQALGGAKEIKISGNEKNFSNRYKIANELIAKTSTSEDVIRTLPKLLLELSAVLLICLLVIYLVNLSAGLSNILPTLGIFTAAGIRLIPSLNGLILANTKLKSNSYAIDLISKDLALKLYDQSIYNNNINNIKLTGNIIIKNLNFKYQTGKENVFNDFNLEIKLNQTTGIIGKSGSGKTTLIDLILGLLDPDKGSILINGKDLKDFRRFWQNNIGYVAQDIFLADETLKENIALGVNAEKINKIKLNEAINLSKIDDFINDLPDGANTMIGDRGVRLSGGQRQRIGIARALYNRPKILVLDEATSSLDIETESEVIKSIENLHGKLTIIILSHRISAVKNCHKIVQLKKGRILNEGPFDSLKV